MAITNKFFFIFVCEHLSTGNVGIDSQVRKKRLKQFLIYKKSYSKFLYFNHPFCWNFQKTFQLLVLAQTALMLVNYFAVVVWFFCYVLNSFYYFLISSLQITHSCLNALMLICCQCEKSKGLIISSHPVCVWFDSIQFLYTAFPLISVSCAYLFWNIEVRCLLQGGT